jgi:hypothetical protein
LDAQQQNEFTNKIYTMIGLNGWYKEVKKEGLLLSVKKLMSKPEIQQYLLINRYQGVLWFNRERFEALNFWLFVINILEIGSDSSVSATTFVEEFLRMNKIFIKLENALSLSEFNIEKLLQILEKDFPNTVS